MSEILGKINFDIMDNSRTNIVLRFRCAKCGRILRLTNKGPSPYAESKTDKGEYDDDGITGANKVETTAAFIHPCANCYGKARQPAELIQKALEKAKELENG